MIRNLPQIETQMIDSQEEFFSGDQSDSSPETSLMDVLSALMAHRRLIAAVTIATALVSAVVASLIPNRFRAEATILPPQQQQSSLASLASGALGGLAAANMASSLGLKNPSDLYIGILQSRTIADDIINRFRLQQTYHDRYLSEARKEFTKHASFTSGKDSLIKIDFEDQDPRRAAEIANALVDELYSANSRLAITDASQRRLFFEQELRKEKDALANAEIALKETQQKSGLLIPGGQAEALIRSVAQLRAQIASREVQLQAMRSYATDENPQVQVVKQEIAALQSQQARLEANSGGPSLEIPAGRLPEASLEYIRHLRDLKYHETLYELLAKQYEAARIDEAKQAPVIQVLDRAIVPDGKSWPPRAILVVTASLLAFALSSAGVLAAWRVKTLWTGKPSCGTV